MADTQIDSKIQDLKSAATNQTEFVHGLVMFLLIHTKAIDDIIESYGSDELKELSAPFRQAIPEFGIALATEIGKIHENNNELS
jgi:hypothetical protein